MAMKDEMEQGLRKIADMQTEIANLREKLQEERYQRRKMERALSAVKWLLQQINAAENFEI